VCSADLESRLDQRPAARQLRHSLLAYAAGEQFKPKVEVSSDDLRKMLDRNKPSRLVRLGAKVIKADSEDRENGNVAANAIDGDADTFWHTRWQPANDPMPHDLVIDLGREIALKGLTYLPRQDQANGRIASAEIFLGSSPAAWGERAAAVNWTDTTELQRVRFDRTVRGRYLRLVVRSEVHGNPFAAVAELDVLPEVP